MRRGIPDIQQACNLKTWEIGQLQLVMVIYSQQSGIVGDLDADLNRNIIERAFDIQRGHRQLLRELTD